MGTRRRRRSGPAARLLLATGALLAGCAGGGLAGGLGGPPAQLAPPRAEGGWLFPAEGEPARPVWGLEEGLRVSVWPACEPRGAVCVHAPYLGLAPDVAVSRLVLELQADGARARTDGGSGGEAVAWRPVAERGGESQLAPPWRPPRGRPEGAGPESRLTLRLRAERPLASGVRPELRLTLRRDRPYALAVDLRAAPGSAAPERAALVADRAAFARLRTLWLAGRAASVASLWPELGAGGEGDPPERRFEAAALEEREGALWITAVPEAILEARASAEPADVPEAWRYEGEPSLQYLRTPARPGVTARAAPARRFPGTRAAIPGGPALRAFALEAPWSGEGARFVHGVEPR